MPKRSDYITWDEYFMGVAILAAQRSKDPNTQVGACIVSQDNKILSIGYNGMPLGCSDDEFAWGRDVEHDNKYFYIVHSELNAVKFMLPYFLVMNAPKQLFKAVFAKSFIGRINIKIHRKLSPPNAC